MKNAKLIASSAILALTMSATAFAKPGTISTTKVGTISTTKVGTISTTKTGTISTTGMSGGRTGTISTTQMGTISLTRTDLSSSSDRWPLFELLLTVLGQW